MPIAAEAKTATPSKVKAAVQDPFERNALAGRSPLEAAIEKPSVKSAPDPVDEVGTPIDSSALKQAQAKDVAAKSAKSEPVEGPAKEGDGAARATASPLDDWRPKGEKAGKQWDELKAKHTVEAAALKAEVERTKAELAAAKGVGDPEEIKTLKDELKRYRELIKDVAIEKDPGFKQKFEPREKTAIEAAKLAAGDKGSQLETLLKSPSGPWRDEQIEAIKSELSQSSQIRVDSALRMLDQIDLEKQSEIATQRANFEQKQYALLGQQKEQQAAQLKEMTAVFDSTLKEWSDPANGHPFFTERDGDKEHNAGVAASKELAKAIFSGQMTPQDLARAALWGASGDRILKGWQGAIARAEKAEKALAKIQAAEPGDGLQGEADTDDTTPAPAPGSVGYMKWLNSELKARQERDLTARRGG